ncbi:phage major capsid protein [Brevibacillus dissolubilis]|uniref:phage major capsid protein n=1 Tax=Brevibacillus dissolubilis TaxID=1844116 RepID=UPI00159B85B1|nr:phage major capsid protein [Brevibacillus dissolubilis]
MGISNRQLIDKAAISLSSFTNGGVMTPEQSAQFFRMVQGAPTLLKDARLVQMKSDQVKLEKAGFGSRILRSGDSADANASGTIQLNGKEIVAEIGITYDSIENNLEGTTVEDALMQMLAERVAVDLEELVVNGDAASSDPFLKLMNGVRKQAVSHVVDQASAAFDQSAFKNAYMAVPSKFLRNPAEWRFYTSHAVDVAWKQMVAATQPTIGDTTTQSNSTSVYGIPVQGLAMLQNYNDGAGNLVSDMLLTHPKNIVVGLNRDIRIEVDKDIRARQFIVVLTAKIDATFEEEDAVAKVIKVKA